MTDFDRSPDGLAFTEAVRDAQSRFGSRRHYEQVEWPIDISEKLEAFIGLQRSVFLASASSNGQPYVQHRGGRPGFIKVLDSRTLGMPDFEGNRQYITFGNLTENDRVVLFLIDYTQQRRAKIWGRARFVEGDPALLQRLASDQPNAKASRALVISVEAWDINCPRHIPKRFEAEDLAREISQRDARIAELEREIAVLEQQRSVKDICGDDLW